MQSRRQVEDEEDQRCHDERVHATRDGVSQLVAQLHPVVIQPATINDGYAIQVRNVVSGEEGCEDVADKPADAMHSEYIQSIINAEKELELRAIVGKGCA